MTRDCAIGLAKGHSCQVERCRTCGSVWRHRPTLFGAAVNPQPEIRRGYSRDRKSRSAALKKAGLSTNMLCAAFGTTIGSATGLHLRIAADIAGKFFGLFSPWINR